MKMGLTKTATLGMSFIILLSACVAEPTIEANETPPTTQPVISTPKSDPIKDDIATAFSSFCDTEFMDISSLGDRTVVNIYDQDIDVPIQEAIGTGAAPDNWDDTKTTLIDLSETSPLLNNTTRCAVYLMASEDGEIYLTVSEGTVLFDIFRQIEEKPREMTLGEKNALSKADDYFSIMAFSYSGLINQLKFDGFTESEATFAADNCAVDWNEQAASKARTYLDLMAFSRQGLIDQLMFDGFTQAQAEYGVSAVGY